MVAEDNWTCSEVSVDGSPRSRLHSPLTHQPLAVRSRLARRVWEEVEHGIDVPHHRRDHVGFRCAVGVWAVGRSFRRLGLGV